MITIPLDIQILRILGSQYEKHYHDCSLSIVYYHKKETTQVCELCPETKILRIYNNDVLSLMKQSSLKCEIYDCVVPIESHNMVINKASRFVRRMRILRRLLDI